jgi:Tfp pilus assembly protein PilF
MKTTMKKLVLGWALPVLAVATLMTQSDLLVARATAAEQEYLPGVDEKAQDAMRAGLSAALRRVPKCNPFQILDDGQCCPAGFVSLGKSCARIAPNQCASVAIENPAGCSLDQCAKYSRTEKKKEKIKTEDGKEEEVEKDIEVPCEPWVAGVRDLACELDTKTCDKKLMSSPPKWCADWIKKVEAMPAADEAGKPVAGTPNFKYQRCKAGSENCDLVPRECSEKELESGASDGAGPCKVGEYIEPSSNKCTAYGCPGACKTDDGRCTKCGPDYQSAAQEFQKAASADKRFYEAYFNLGMALERLGKFDEARKSYETAKGIEPKDDRDRSLQLSAGAYIARSLLAQSHRALDAGETDKAKQIREQAKGICDSIMAQDPDNAMNNVALAMYWLESGDLKISEDFLRLALRVNREDTIALNIRGLINLKQGKYEIARWILEEKVLTIDPANPEAWGNLGMAYVSLKDLPSAVKAFKNAVQLSAGAVSARMNLGAIYLEYLNYRDAEKVYKEALELEPNNLEALTGYALTLEGRRDPKKAAETYEKVLAKEPQRYAILIRLAIIYYKHFNNGEKAVSLWKQYLKDALNTDPETAAATADKLKADRDAAREALKAHVALKKPGADWAATLVLIKAAPAAKKGGADFAAKRTELIKKCDELDVKWKNLVAIVSRIQEIEAAKTLEKQAKQPDSAPK